MKLLLKFLFITVIGFVIYGYYLKNSGNHPEGDKWVGIGILIMSFIWMPIFIYRNWKNKKVKDYMLTEENLKKMRDYSKDKQKISKKKM